MIIMIALELQITYANCTGNIFKFKFVEKFEVIEAVLGNENVKRKGVVKYIDHFNHDHQRNLRSEVNLISVRYSRNAGRK